MHGSFSKRLASPSLIKSAVAAAVLAAAATPSLAFVAGAHTFLSVGIFGRFNVVTSDNFTSQHSDQQCGFAAGGDVLLKGGYSIGSARMNLVGDPSRTPIGLLVGKSLVWSDHPSGTIQGDVFIGQGANVSIAPDASVTLPAPYTVNTISPGLAMQALDPELWIGYAGNTVNAVFGQGNYNNVTVNNSGVTVHGPLPLVFQAAYNSYLGDMATKARVATANGTTQVETHGGGKNIVLDGRNLKLKDMPGNMLPSGALNPNKPGAMRTVYIFDVNASDLSDARYVGLRNAPATDDSLQQIGQSASPDPTWTLVRVKANGQSSVTLANLGLQDFADRNRRVMWLFDDAITTINLSGVGIEGTIVAPKAHVVANNGNINGTILAKSFEGTMEGHCAPFFNYLDPVAGE